MLRHRHPSPRPSSAPSVRRRRRARAVLVSVPPYHIAGIANPLSNLYAGRRRLPRPSSTPRAGSTPWQRADHQRHGRPRCSSRICIDLTSRPRARLRPALGYSAMAAPARRRQTCQGHARLLPHVDPRQSFYGLTETSSPPSPLGPEGPPGRRDGDPVATTGCRRSASQVCHRRGAGGPRRSRRGGLQAGEIWVRGRRAILLCPASTPADNPDDDGGFPTRPHQLGWTRRTDLFIGGPGGRHHHPWRRERGAGRGRKEVLLAPRRGRARGRGPADDE